MFRQVKSMFFWSMIYKFRRRLTLVVILLSVVLLSQWIYSDLVEYLKLTKNTEYLHIILPIKWLVIFFNIGFSAYLVMSLFKDNAKEKREEGTSPKVESEELSQREKEFMKRDIRSEAQIILDKHNK